MSERVSSGEDELLNQSISVEQSLATMSTPERITTKAVEPAVEEYPLPATTDAVERMKFLSRDLAELKYERGKSGESVEAIEEAIRTTETELATLNSDPEIQKSYQEFFNQKVELAEKVGQLSRTKGKIDSMDARIQKISRQHSRGLVPSFFKNEIRSLGEQKNKLHQEMTKTLASPEIELAWRSHQLREYRQYWEQNHFVETPSRRELINRLQDLWVDGKKTLVTGPTGTGKTELVKRAARQYSDGEPEIISGHQGLTTYEVYGKPKLGPGALSDEETSLWERRISEAEDESQRQFLLAQYQQLGGVVSGFNLGKLPQAAKNGRVVIYDEIDLVPSKTLLRHKADFNLRVGEKLTIQEDSNQSIEIQKGFGVAATANLKSVKHKERDEIDPAILRLFEPLPVKFFPKDELYDLCLATLIDRRGALEMSLQDAGQTLAKLVEAATDVQEAYLGVTTKFYEKGGGSTSKTAFLNKAVLDPGRLLGLLSGYQIESLRGVTFKNFVERELTNFVNNEAYSDKERFTLLDIFTQHGFLLNRSQNDFLPAQYSADEWQRHIRAKKAVAEVEPTYLDPRSVATLDPFNVRQAQVTESAEQFLAKAPPQTFDQDGRLEATSELEKTLGLPEQYSNMITALEKSGMIEPLTGGFGIKAINGREYQLPAYAEIVQELSRRPELKTKIDQGFTKLLIVPFGRSLNELIEKYRGTLEQNKDHLQATDGSKLEIGANGSLYVWESYMDADVKGKLVYQQTSFNQKNHGGRTKADILTTSQGFQVLLIEDLPDLPAGGAGQTVGGRKQLEADRIPADYLATIQTDPIYQDEVGLGPEDELTLATSELINRQLVIDDLQGQGKAAYLPGAYFPASGGVPIATWRRGSGRAALHGYDPAYRSADYGVRVGVRVL